jgi:hypothetical protein
VPLLGKSNDFSLWSLLMSYISTNPVRAEEILNAIRSIGKYESNYLTQILNHCFNVVKEENK